MFGKTLLLSLAAAAAAALLANTAQATTIEIETVPVGNPGNPSEQIALPYGDTNYYGGVAYEYRIGKYEVTAGQYRDFLNAVDPSGTNTFGLYNSLMNSRESGCQITWNSVSSTYDFSGGTVEVPGSTAVDWENRPVNYVSFWDAARFANWLHNGQGGGYMESGAYTLTAEGMANNTVVRDAGARYFIPTEDEWYKAAYHDKSAGLAATYFNYPTSNDSDPGRDMSEATNPGNNANHGGGGGDLIGSPYYRTEVGEFELSDSPYGTFDQCGNVHEWNETAVTASSRGMRGSDWLSSHLYSHTFNPSGHGRPTYEESYIGFRVASVPEPGSITLLVCGAVGVFAYGWRRRKAA